MERVHIGRVRAAHGIKGELKIEPMTDDPNRFKDLKEIILSTHQSTTVFPIEQVRFHHGDLLLKLKGIDDRNEAERYKNAYCDINKAERLTLPEDRFYIDDLIGLAVYEADEYLGHIQEVLQPGANDVYVVKKEDGKTLYIPALKTVVQSIRLSDQEMHVRLPKGLRDL